MDGTGKITPPCWHIHANDSSLTLPLPRKRLSGCACHSPLAHFYIHHTESSIHEIHPFTSITHLASQKTLVQEGESSIMIQFLFRQSVASATPQAMSQPQLKKSTQWTNRLGSLVDEEKATPDQSAISLVNHGVETALRLEGPYFTAANPELYKTVICFVAGTGVSGAIAIAAAFDAQKAKPRSKLNPSSLEEEAACRVSEESTSSWNRCIVVWTVREKEYINIPSFNGKNSLHILSCYEC
jgi:hypothetical protein